MHGHNFMEIFASSDVKLAALGVPVVQDDVVGFSSLAVQSGSEHRRVRRGLIEARLGRLGARLVGLDGHVHGHSPNLDEHTF